MPRPDFPKTILEFQRRFANEEECEEYLFESRWPDGFVCPRCGNHTYWWLQTRSSAQCKACRYQASLTAGTVMHRTRVGLLPWFWGAYLVTTHTPGFSAVQFQRYVGLKRYETAFALLHKLRAGMVSPEREKLRGHIEVDETYIGGRRHGKVGRGAEGKAIVVGALEVLDPGEKRERAGRLRLRVVPDVSSESLVGFVKDTVMRRACIITDDFISYGSVRKANYGHWIVEPGEMAHIHRTFSNLKTWLLGTHHGVSQKHLQAYLNEFVFRHNRRRTPMAAFQTVLGLGTHADAPTYEGLYKGRWTHPNPLGVSEATG